MDINGFMRIMEDIVNDNSIREMETIETLIGDSTVWFSLN